MERFSHRAMKLNFSEERCRTFTCSAVFHPTTQPPSPVSPIDTCLRASTARRRTFYRTRGSVRHASSVHRRHWQKQPTGHTARRTTAEYVAPRFRALTCWLCAGHPVIPGQDQVAGAVHRGAVSRNAPNITCASMSGVAPAEAAIRPPDQRPN